MSVLVYHDHVLAADTASWASSVIVGHLRKIFATPTFLGGVVGVMEIDRRFKKWLRAERFDKFEPNAGNNEFQALWIARASGEVFFMNQQGEWHSLGHPQTSIIGHESAVACALGAIKAGASASQAVRIAIDNTDGAAGRVHTLYL